jgi:hypothetical protein
VVNDIRFSGDKLLDLVQTVGHSAALVYQMFVAWTKVEIQDPSNPSAHLGIVCVNNVYELSDEVLSAATNGRISPDSFSRGRSKLQQAGEIVQKTKQHGQYIVVVNSVKLQSKTYTYYPAHPRYQWIFEIDRFKDYRPAVNEVSENRVPEPPAVGENHAPGRENRVPESENRVPEVIFRVPETSGRLKNQQDAPLGIELGKNKEGIREEQQSHSSSTNAPQSGQVDIGELRRHPEYKRASDLVRKLVARATKSGITFTNKPKTELLADLLEQLEALNYSDDVCLACLDDLINDLQHDDGDNDHFAMKQGASRIASSFVPKLLGDGQTKGFAETHLKNKADIASTKEKIEEEAWAIHRELAQRKEEEAAGEEFVAWEQLHGGLRLDGSDGSSEFISSNPSAFERWQIREQMEGVYPEERTKLQAKLDGMRRSAQPQVEENNNADAAGL